MRNQATARANDKQQKQKHGPSSDGPESGRSRARNAADSTVLGAPKVERHEAIWLDGRVPNGYWDELPNRRLYLRWLGQRLGFRTHQDWYRITTDDFKRNAGGGLLHYWHDSAIFAVKESYRDYDWKEWLFNITPRRFWQDRRMHRQYMQWLGEQLGIRDPADWYHVTNQDFRDHGGGAFLIHYDSTVSAAIKSFLPQYGWKEWLFDKTPKGFWHERKNRRRYMTWLGARLGYQSLDDWYAVTTDDFNANYGNQLLKLYGGSPVAALKDCFPKHHWLEWRFARVPVGFWDDLANCRRYIRWLANKLHVKRPQDWRRVRRRDWLQNCGGGLLAMVHSPWDVLVKCYPGLAKVAQAPERTGSSERPTTPRRPSDARTARAAHSAARRSRRQKSGRNAAGRPCPVTPAEKRNRRG